MRVMTVVGARPQFIKAATVSRQFRRRNDVHEILVHTGQHFDAAMSDVFFSELDIPPPTHNLGIHGGGHGEMTGRMLAALEPLIQAERPDCMLVYGDTNSTLAAALAAAKLTIPVAHVEAGLRSFNRTMPEEINRLVTDQLASLRFCPTRAAMDNLAREGMAAGCHLVGDVMYDATLAAIAAARRSPVLERLRLAPGAYALATIHRAENTGQAEDLAKLLDYLKCQAQDMPVILPLHPRTRALIQGAALPLDGLTAIEPLGYLDMQSLLAGAAQVLTDSGGLQKEAYFHRVPCVTLRHETEWVETIQCGWNRLWTQPHYLPRCEINEYGDGAAAARVVDILLGTAGV
jgi:UDP-GlcNAc3NAcA epimerase